MSFKPVRTFLTNRLLEVDSAFEAYESPFANDYVGDNNFDKRFHIGYNQITTTVANQNVTNDIVAAQVTLFFRGGRDNQENPLDEATDIANKFRINCLRPRFVRAETHIKNVVCTSIASQPLDGNDQAFKIVLSFNINTIYGLAVDLDSE